MCSAVDPQDQHEEQQYTNYQNNHTVNCKEMTQRTCDPPKVQTESVHCDKVQTNSPCVNNETNHNTAELQDKQHNIIDRASVYSGRSRNTQNASRTYIRETVLILQCSS